MDELNEKIDLAEIDAIVAACGRGADAAIPILRAIQERYRFLPRAALERVCSTTAITPTQIAGVSTFYNFFRHTPTGRHLVRICHGTACHVAGAERITEAVRRYLALKGEEDTDAARDFTIETVPCLGCCSLAPCMTCEQETFAWLDPDKATTTLAHIRSGTDAE